VEHAIVVNREVIDGRDMKGTITLNQLSIESGVIRSIRSIGNANYGRSVEDLYDDNKSFVSSIPSGIYGMTMAVMTKYKDTTKIKYPLLLDTHPRSGIFMHKGLNHTHTEGCVLNSDANAFQSLLTTIKELAMAGNEIRYFIICDSPAVINYYKSADISKIQ